MRDVFIGLCVHDHKFSTLTSHLRKQIKSYVTGRFRIIQSAVSVFLYDDRVRLTRRFRGFCHFNHSLPSKCCNRAELYCAETWSPNVAAVSEIALATAPNYHGFTIESILGLAPISNVSTFHTSSVC